VSDYFQTVEIAGGDLVGELPRMEREHLANVR
jgi:hypothetical protein